MGRRIGAWLGWISAALLLYFFENNTGTRAVLVVTILVPLFSMGCARLAAGRLAVSIQAPEKAAAGGRIRCTIRLNRSVWRIGCLVTCRLTGRNRLTGETSETEIPVPYSGICEPEAVSSRCGCLSLAVSRTEVRDWFGLVCFARSVRAEATVLIRPDLYPVSLRKDPDTGACSREAGGSHRPAEDPEPGDLRPYIPGDDVRRIHWKLSEKTNQTLVRESAPEALDRIALLLETDFPEQIDPEAMHSAARGLLSVSRAMATEGIAHIVAYALDGEADMAEVTGEESFRKAEEQVLAADSSTGGTSIGTLFSRQNPELRFRRIIVFAPHPETDGMTPAERRDVTLVLPAFVPCTASGSGIRVTEIDPADAQIDI